MNVKHLLGGFVLALAASTAQLSAAPVRILAFGDSLTEGYGLPTHLGLVPQLQAWLRARGHDVVVINGGLAGDTAVGGRIRITYSLAQATPDAVIVELGGNDLLMGFTPEATQKSLDSILTTAGQNDRPLLLVGIASPYQKPDEAAEWAKIWPALAQKHDTLLLPNLYQPLMDMPGTTWKSKLQADGIHANVEGVEMIVDNLGPKVESLIAKIPKK